MTSTVDEARVRARRLFDAAEFDQSLKAALEGLSASPDDVELLVLAGRAGTEVDADDAVEHLRRASELAADQPEVWHHFGEALAAEGNMTEAEAAFRRAVELDPGDQVALSHLGHTALAAGRDEEGVQYLARAADIAHAVSNASISLVDMYRAFGQNDDALAQARLIADAAPDDVLAWLDLAELSMAVGQLDEALSAFERLRELDDVPGHEAYPLHGMLRVEIRRGDWERAEALVAQLAAIDPQGLSADLSAFLADRRGAGEEPAPDQAEVEAALGSSLADYRGTLTEDRRLDSGEPVG